MRNLGCINKNYDPNKIKSTGNLPMLKKDKIYQLDSSLISIYFNKITFIDTPCSTSSMRGYILFEKKKEEVSPPFTINV